MNDYVCVCRVFGCHHRYGLFSNTSSLHNDYTIMCTVQRRRWHRISSSRNSNLCTANALMHSTFNEKWMDEKKRIESGQAQLWLFVYLRLHSFLAGVIRIKIVIVYMSAATSANVFSLFFFSVALACSHRIGLFLPLGSALGQCHSFFNVQVTFFSLFFLSARAKRINRILFLFCLSISHTLGIHSSLFHTQTHGIHTYLENTEKAVIM